MSRDADFLDTEGGGTSLFFWTAFSSCVTRVRQSCILSSDLTASPCLRTDTTFYGMDCGNVRVSRTIRSGASGMISPVRHQYIVADIA